MERKAIGTHSVFYAQVEATRLGDEPAETLIWFDRGFHSLVATVKPDEA
ncbi:hypothetical protein [Breoghania sp.]|nr:hypothetical protein [Breoghania sp.]